VVGVRRRVRVSRPAAMREEKDCMAWCIEEC